MLNMMIMRHEIFLVLMNVKSMYTMIPQDEGINSLLTKLDITGLPKHIQRELMNLIFKNTFSFNGLMKGSWAHPTMYSTDLHKTIYFTCKACMVTQLCVHCTVVSIVLI